MDLFDTEAWIATLTGVVLVVAGIVVALVTGGATAAIGAGLIGLGLVILVALVFYLVGRSEDRDRITHPRG